MQFKLSLKRLSVKKKHLLLSFLLIFIVGLGVGMYFFLTSYFAVKNIVVDKKNGPKVALNGLYALQGENMLTLDEKMIGAQLYKQNPSLKSIGVTKEWPNTLHIQVYYSDPFVYLEVSNGYYVLSDSGRIIQKTKQKNDIYPIIHYYEKLNYDSSSNGEQIGYSDIMSSLVFLKKARELGLAINSIDIHGINMIALSTDKESILFTMDKSQRDQLYQFERVVKEFKIQGKQFKTLDVRFDRIIVSS